MRNNFQQNTSLLHKTSENLMQKTIPTQTFIENICLQPLCLPRRSCWKPWRALELSRDLFWIFK